MTKSEAIDALEQGQKVTHYYFSDDEWMIEHNGQYKFEDGVSMDRNEFWAIRTLEGWQDSWEIFGDA